MSVGVMSDGVLSDGGMSEGVMAMSKGVVIQEAMDKGATSKVAMRVANQAKE